MFFFFQSALTPHGGFPFLCDDKRWTQSLFSCQHWTLSHRRTPVSKSKAPPSFVAAETSRRTPPPPPYWEQDSFSFCSFSVIYSNLFPCIFAPCYCIDVTSVCTAPFPLLVDARWGCVFGACVWGGWTQAMCLVRALAATLWVFTNHVNRRTIKCTNRALWVTVLATSPSTLGIITQSPRSPLWFHSGPGERTPRSATAEMA